MTLTGPENVFNFPAEVVKAQFEPGYRTDFGIGYRVTRDVGLEFNTGFIQNSVNDTDGMFAVPNATFNIDQVPVMMNVVYHIPLKAAIKPFVGGGGGGVIGIIHLSAPYEPSTTDADVAAGLRAMAGVNVNITRSLDFGLTYKLLATSGYDWYVLGGTKVSTDDLVNHSILFSLTLRL